MRRKTKKTMDKMLASMVQHVVGKAEKVAPVKSVKMKVKFHKPKEKKYKRT